MTTNLALAVWNWVKPKLQPKYRDDEELYGELRDLIETTMFHAFKRLFS